MGKLKKFVIEFVAVDDKKVDDECFVAGQTINGKLSVELSQPMEIRRKHDVTLSHYNLLINHTDTERSTCAMSQP